MTTQLLGNGPTEWEISQDDMGQRDYHATFQVISDDKFDGPYTVLRCPGLPVVGVPWIIGNDDDPDAFLKQDGSARPREQQGKSLIWDVKLHWSTKPDKRCNETPVTDPLLEPQKVSGSFVKYNLERTNDRFGNPIQSSGRDQFRGAQVEFDANRPQVKIEQNVADLQLGLLGQLQDCVNDDVMWGLPRRCIKLSNIHWERHYRTVCQTYYTRTLEFDIRYETFDRDLVDRGMSCLRGHWDTLVSSPTYGQWIIDPGVGGGAASDYVRYTDWKGDPHETMLDGNGLPVVRKYSTSPPALGINAATVAVAGNGYTVGDTLTVVGGTGTAATLTVQRATGGGGGKVIQVSVASMGSYSIAPTGPVAVTGGSGTGATFNIGLIYLPVGVSGATISGGVSIGYSVGDVLTVAGGTSTAPAQLLVTAVTGGTGLVSVVVINAGSYSVPPPNDVTCTGGAGSGATFTLNWATIQNAVNVGKIHVEVYNESNFFLLNIPTVLT